MSLYCDFPGVLDALPPYLSNLVSAISSNKKVHPCMALPTLISGMAAGVHGGRCLTMPDGSDEPLGLTSIILAERLTGKTRAFEEVHTAHVGHDVMRYQRFKALKEAKIKAKLREVIQTMATARTLMDSLDGSGHSTSISTFEGKLALDSQIFRRQLGLMCMIWDSSSKVTLPLPNGDRLIAYKPSLNVLLMVQPSEFAKYYVRDGDSARGIGFMARCLITLVPDHNYHVDMVKSEADVCIKEYTLDVDEYLRTQDQMLEAGNVVRERIQLSSGARVLWDELQVEVDQTSTFYTLGFEDAVGRIMQQVARLAGVIQSYYPHRPEDSRLERLTGDCAEAMNVVSAGTLKAAWVIAQWHLSQFKLLFPFSFPALAAPLASPPPKLSTQQKRYKTIVEDAETVMLHFQIERHHSGEEAVLKNAVVARSGLYQQRFSAALFYLTDGDWLVLEKEGRKARLYAGTRPFNFTVPSHQQA